MGIRSATFGSPAVTCQGTTLVFGQSTVRGPGQNASIRFCARGDGVHTISTMLKVAKEQKAKEKADGEGGKKIDEVDLDALKA